MNKYTVVVLVASLVILSNCYKNYLNSEDIEELVRVQGNVIQYINDVDKFNAEVDRKRH